MEGDMLTRFKSRRLAALVVLAGASNAAALLGAQAPRRTAPKAPRLIADCDITVQSCGGAPTLEGYYGTQGTGTVEESTPYDDGSSVICWSGTNKLCGKDSTVVCTQWVASSGSGSISITGGVSPGGSVSGSASGQCIGTTSMVRYYYWSK
jgi:hypothetical protein